MSKKQKLLDWVARSGPLLESQVVGSGLNAALNECLREGSLTIIAHPTVKDGNAPAAGVALPANTSPKD